MPVGYSEGDTFYWQFRQRFSPEMFNPAISGGGWKQALFVNAYSSCAQVEIALTNAYYYNFPQMYSRCGADGFQVDLGTGDFLLQWGDDWPINPHPFQLVECHYQNVGAPPAGGCHYYQPNEWMTFSFEAHIGHWGQPDSYVKAWMGRAGEPLHQFVNNDPWTALQDSPGAIYERIILLPYNTGKDGTVDHPTAYTWYDELIISSNPIPDPFRPGLFVDGFESGNTAVWGSVVP